MDTYPPVLLFGGISSMGPQLARGHRGYMRGPG